MCNGRTAGFKYDNINQMQMKIVNLKIPLFAHSSIVENNDTLYFVGNWGVRPVTVPPRWRPLQAGTQHLHRVSETSRRFLQGQASAADAGPAKAVTPGRWRLVWLRSAPGVCPYRRPHSVRSQGQEDSFPIPWWRNCGPWQVLHYQVNNLTLV